MRRLVTGILIAAFSITAGALRGTTSEAVQGDDEVVFLPTFAQPAADGGWEATIHGWVYQPERDSVKRRILLGLLGRSLGHDEADLDREQFRNRAGAFLVDNQPGKRLAIEIGDHVYPLPPSLPNGHFGATVHVAAETVARLRALAPGATGIPFTLSRASFADPADARRFAGVIEPLDATGMSVVSDIDDTIRITECRDRKALVRNTFLLPFRPVTGMAAAYRRWAAGGAHFHYLSASPWQLYTPLSVFADAEGFPAGTWNLKQFRWKDETFWDLFADPELHKRTTLEPLLAAFPQRRFVLIGDSGQSDPECFGALARKHPAQIVRIFIRDITGGGRGAPRYAGAFAGVPEENWLLFEEGAHLPTTLP
ncbi:MAG: App1 family protein [Planctomycetes bacterium]|nr:App1 family protein [Planctomycetota bacterium]